MNEILEERPYWFHCLLLFRVFMNWFLCRCWCLHWQMLTTRRQTYIVYRDVCIKLRVLNAEVCIIFLILSKFWIHQIIYFEFARIYPSIYFIHLQYSVDYNNFFVFNLNRLNLSKYIKTNLSQVSKWMYFSYNAPTQIRGQIHLIVQIQYGCQIIRKLKKKKSPYDSINMAEKINITDIIGGKYFLKTMVCLSYIYPWMDLKYSFRRPISKHLLNQTKRTKNCQIATIYNEYLIISIFGKSISIFRRYFVVRYMRDDFHFLKRQQTIMIYSRFDCITNWYSL